MADPVIIPSGATALEVIQSVIAEHTPAAVIGQTLFMGSTPDTPDDAGLVYLVIEGPSQDPDLTMGTVVALEHTRVDIIVYGEPGQFMAPKKEAMRLRYLMASLPETTALGLRMLSALPKGNIESLGQDPRNREHFMVKLDVTTEPSYVQ